jgi:mannose-6-phosphate isomerase-like protein (cupin superfamily)
MHSLAITDRHVARDWFADEVASAATSPQGPATMVERTAPEGAMPPLLRRDEPETYRVLSGEVVFFVGDETVRAGAGDVVVAPRGVARTFRVASEGARWLVLTQVRSLDRFSDFGRAVSAPLTDPDAGWPSQSERAAVASIAAANGIELLGPPGALPRRD